MNNEIEDDGSVKPLVTFKKQRVVVGHIEPIKAKDIRFGRTVSAIEQEPTPVVEKLRPELQYQLMKESFLTRLEELIESNAVFNTHRIPAGIIARHMAESAYQFNASLFLHNTAVTMKEKQAVARQAEEDA